MLLDRGICGDRRYLSRATCGLVYGYESPKAVVGDWVLINLILRVMIIVLVLLKLLPLLFGHTGFTGTCVWVDPDNELVFVFLSNRTYPVVFGHDNLMKLDIRSRIQQAMYQSIMY